MVVCRGGGQTDVLLEVVWGLRPLPLARRSMDDYSALGHLIELLAETAVARNVRNMGRTHTDDPHAQLSSRIRYSGRYVVENPPKTGRWPA